MSSSRRLIRVVSMLVLAAGFTSFACGVPGTASAVPGVLDPTSNVPVQGGNKPAAPPPFIPRPPTPPVHKMPELSPARQHVPEPRQSRPPTVVSFRANLENFRAYRGEKSPAIFSALISREVAPAIHQEPPIALSDGTTTVKISANINPDDRNAPNFALNGAALVSLKKDPASPSTWVIEALPKQNITTADLTILTSDNLIKYPLNLAPPVVDISATETDFVAFLRDSNVSPPKRDLNGDGRHDYLDDFIYTANYLVRKKAEGRNTRYKKPAPGPTK